MKKILYILIISQFILNCERTKKDHIPTQEEFYYPTKSFFKNDSLINRINLDSVKNFGDLLKISDSIACDRKSPMIHFQNTKSEFKRLVAKDCLLSMGISDYKERNIIFIKGDSIIINDLLVKSFDNIKKVFYQNIS